MQDIQNQIMSLNGLVKRSQCESSSLTLKKNLEKIREVGENIQSNLDYVKEYQNLGKGAPGWFRLDKCLEGLASGLEAPAS